MFKKGEICILNEEGAEYFNLFAKECGAVEVKAGDKVVCRETDDNPFCTPLDYFKKGDGEYTIKNSGNCMRTWSLDEGSLQSTGEFMELD